MYSKTGLGLLAAAGLVLGVIGMQAGGASPSSTASGCAGASTSDGSASSGSGDTASGDAGAGVTVPTTNPAAPRTPTTPTTGHPGSSNNGGGSGGSGGDTNGQGLLSVDTSGLPGGGIGTVTVPDPAGSGDGSGSGSPAAPFVDVGTKGNVLPGGTPLPPTDTRIIARSQYLSRLLRLYVQANTHR